jgi:hypothetical protein
MRLAALGRANSRYSEFFYFVCDFFLLTMGEMRKHGE